MQHGSRMSNHLERPEGGRSRRGISYPVCLSNYLYIVRDADHYLA
jgi:hypothetical protein